MSNRPDFPGRADWYGISKLAVGWRVDTGDAPATVVVEGHDPWEQEAQVEHQAPRERAALAYLGARGLARCLGRVALLVTVVLQVPSYLWPLHDAKRQTWEDKVAGSVVTAGR
jgi:hypothetical protein